MYVCSSPDVFRHLGASIHYISIVSSSSSNTIIISSSSSIRLVLYISIIPLSSLLS